MTDYAAFLDRKTQLGGDHGFDPAFVPDFLFDFQRALVEWNCRKGRSALWADCGLGKGPMQLVWAENVVRKTNRPVIIATPLAVSYQLLHEADKFGIECERVTDGKIRDGARVVVTNYERLDKFTSTDFIGMVCDESSRLKNFDGAQRAIITNFMRKLPYRLLCTATAAPNDYIELGTSSEALGELGHMDMLGRFFRNQNNNSTDTKGHWKGHAAPRMWEQKNWRFKGHAESAFWKWVCSWARAIRKPSDMGFDDGTFVLPPLTEHQHVVHARTSRPGWLFTLPSTNLQEEREERRRTIAERCEKVAELVAESDQALIWCHLNDEGDLLERTIPGARQVKGSQSDEEKEEALLAFQKGDIRFLVTKPKIGAWGLNFQKCAHTTFFPSHSYEQYYQGVRRLWRFGQGRKVRVDVIATEGEAYVMENLQRKARQADRMFDALLEHMNNAEQITRTNTFTASPRVPEWLSQSNALPIASPSTSEIAAK